MSSSLGAMDDPGDLYRLPGQQFAQVGLPHQQGDQRFVQALLKFLGHSRPYLEGDSSSSLLEVLRLNSVYFRVVERPQKVLARRMRPGCLIGFDCSTGTPYVLQYQLTGTRALKLDSAGIFQPISGILPNLEPLAIEVYPPFPFLLSSVRDILAFAYRREVSSFAALILISVLVLLFGLAVPILSGVIVSDVLPQGSYVSLAGYLLLIALVILASVASQYVQSMLMLRIETLADLRLQTAAWDRFSRLPLRSLYASSFGQIYVKLSAVSRIRSQLNSGALTSLLKAIFSLAYLGLMYAYDPRLATWVIVIVVLYFAAVAYFARLSISVWHDLYILKSKVSGLSYEVMDALASIRQAQAEPAFYRRWMKLFDRTALLGLKADLYTQMISLLTQSLATAGSVLFFTVLIFRVFREPAILADPSLVGNFVAFYVAFVAFNTAITSATESLVNKFAMILALWSFAKPLLTSAIAPGFDPTALSRPLHGAVVFDRVAFVLPGRVRELVSNLSFELSPGQLLCLTGANDVAKMMVLRLIHGVQPAASGRVLLDQIAVDRFSHASLLRHIGFVPRLPNYSPGLTLLDYLDPTSSFSTKQIRGVCDQVGLANWQAANPEALHAGQSPLLGSLAAIQRKQLALVRALLHQPRILLLEEPILGLSPAEASTLVAYLGSLHMTRVLITNAPGLLKQADHILELS